MLINKRGPHAAARTDRSTPTAQTALGFSTRGVVGAAAVKATSASASSASEKLVAWGRPGRGGEKAGGSGKRTSPELD